VLSTAEGHVGLTLLEGSELLHLWQTSASNHPLQVDDIMSWLPEYKYDHECSPEQATNMSDLPPHTNPLTVKPYSFLNPSCQARRTSILTIDPRLTPAPVPPGPRHRTKFSGKDLERLVRFAAEEEPWTKPHGQVTNSWKTVLGRLQSEGWFKSSSPTTVQNKLNALVVWQEVFQLF
jgi:hypothetical protein